eukprot:1892184-Prymnesium_polylepis.2
MTTARHPQMNADADEATDGEERTVAAGAASLRSVVNTAGSSAQAAPKGAAGGGGGGGGGGGISLALEGRSVTPPPSAESERQLPAHVAVPQGTLSGAQAALLAALG